MSESSCCRNQSGESAGEKCNWSDAPELPEERSLSSPLREIDIDRIDEISSRLAELVDWLDSKATMGNAPTANRNAAVMPAETGTLTWLRLACASDAKGDALRKEAAEQILKQERLEQKSGKWTATQHRYVIVAALLHDTVVLTDSSKPLRKPAEARKLIDEHAKYDERAKALIPECKTHLRTKWIADVLSKRRYLTFCEKNLKKLSGS